MRSRRAVAVMAAFLALVWADTASAAEPSSSSIGPDVPFVEWVGQSFELADSIDPAACIPEADPENAVCDHFWLTAEVDTSYWEGHDGQVVVSIGWLEPADDFDLYLFGEGGDLVASSVARGTTAEQVVVEEPVGTYEVRVVPVSVAASAYTGSVSFASEAVPPEDASDGTTLTPDDSQVVEGSDQQADEADEAAQDDGASGSGGASGNGRSGGGGGSGDGSDRPTAPRSSGSRSAGTSAGSDLWPYNPSYEMRTFDTRALTSRAVDQLSAAAGELAPGLIRGEPAEPQPAVVPAVGDESDGVDGMPVAATTPPRPRSAWPAVALGIVALLLTAVAVFDRVLPIDGSADGAPPGPASV